MQSNFLGWRGYFDLINSVDLFFLYDDVQYTRRDWRNRNRIKTDQGLKWLTVPCHKAPFHALCTEIMIDYSTDWITNHLKMFRAHYSNSLFYEKTYDLIARVYLERYDRLVDLNEDLIRQICDVLGIETDILKTSQLTIPGAKTDRLLNAIKLGGGTDYLSGPAAKDYIEVVKFIDAGIGLSYMTTDYSEYPQLHGSYEKYASIIDLLFNCWGASRFLINQSPNERVI
ncbi:MAG TPA: hypothetical protein ENI23_15605 [bacterium]|nr:hypothetical protein [bacterium]